MKRGFAAIAGAIALLPVLVLPAFAPQLPGTNVFIANTGNQTISFQLRPADGEWTDQQLESGAGSTFECRGCAAFEIKIATDEKHIVAKTLQGKKRYRIFWNSASSLWDIADR